LPSPLEIAAKACGVRGVHDALTPAQRMRLRYCWEARARPLEEREAPAWLATKPAWGVWRGQMVPMGAWLFWLYMAGRASGKTLTGANWVCQYAREHPGCRIAIVGATAGDARRTMVKGKSGILKVSPPWFAPHWYFSDQMLIWPNGSMATLYTADEPGRLNGPEHDAAWADEIGLWKGSDAWDMLMFTMRGGDHPRVLATTTPKDSRLLDTLLADYENLALTIGATAENAKNLPPAFLNKLTARYGGTHLGRQELGGELIANVEGALWTAAQIQALRVDKAPPMVRVVVAVDPASMTQLALATGRIARRSDLCGISVCGVGEDGHGYVLADLSLRASPDKWARVAAKAYKDFKADRIVYETNHGGKAVEDVLRSVDPGLPITGVDARRGKFARAEPVAALYEQGRVHHCAKDEHGEHPDDNGHLAKLEDQMCRWTPRSVDSPDRLDSAVYGLTALMLREEGGFSWD
jgi:phage terminase large subunit-like protein